jgi:energy-coupling factor transport system substrate-specific component
MLDIFAMWKNPKMVIFTIFITLLYPVVMYPFLQYSFFGATADYLRVGVAIPAAFSLLLGPAAAFGAAFGNVIYDSLTNSLNYATLFGFVGNFLIAYIPYKLWSAATNQKPDMRSAKKVMFFMASVTLSCSLCGLVIGWGLFFLYQDYCPFVMTTLTIFASDALWAVVLGPAVLAFCYSFFSKHKLLYGDVMGLQLKSHWSRNRTAGLLVFAFSVIVCFAIPLLLSFDAWMLLPFVLVSVSSVVLASS